jgi:hypothetical protein
MTHGLSQSKRLEGVWWTTGRFMKNAEASLMEELWRRIWGNNIAPALGVT